MKVAEPRPTLSGSVPLILLGNFYGRHQEVIGIATLNAILRGIYP
jgi:hypothetical protein